MSMLISPTTPSVASGPNTQSLDRLLQRLELALNFTSASHNLSHSAYERNRVAANLEHARTLLLQLEHQSAGLRVQSQKTALQAELQRRRESIKRLNARLGEIRTYAADTDSDEDSEDEEGAGRQYAPAVRDTQHGIDTAPSEPLSVTTAHELRSRTPLQASDNRSTASTITREALIAARPQNQAASTPHLQAETLLSHNASQQDVLTSSLLALAQSLKQSSLAFAQSLDNDKAVLARAAGSLDKNAQGMEAAERRMGALRRMTEGQGWWGRLKLYGMIAALWGACFLLVFVGPKLRF